MSISTKEMDALIAQLVEQTLPERPTTEEALQLVRWAEQIRLGQYLLERTLAGDAQLRIDPGTQEPKVTLTAQGRARVDELMRTSPAARRLLDKLIAGPRLARGPKGVQ